MYTRRLEKKNNVKLCLVLMRSYKMCHDLHEKRRGSPVQGHGDGKPRRSRVVIIKYKKLEIYSTPRAHNNNHNNNVSRINHFVRTR